MSELTARWQAVRDRVSAAARAAGRDPSTVTIVAVSKKHPASTVLAAAAAGVTHLGENYVQELLDKRAEVERAMPPTLHWHFIGRLQSNKARAIAGKVALIHAVDSESLARELSKRAETTQPFLLAVNLAGEATKGGVSADDAISLAKTVRGLPNLWLRGLMTMPPPADDPEASRPHFRALRELRDRIQDELGDPLPLLSMGMSDDFEVAIAEGATHVRIGTAIFGTRA